MTFKEFIQFFLENLTVPTLAFCSLLTTIIKTRQSSINAKVTHSLSSLDGYYVVINDKEYLLKDLKIFKK